ncbi:MAG TPA: MFS transporter [Candidatus Limnocylindrales bacterium]|nr:MFS transporter [Candidatus Limnocylindrales bacterium]
MLSTASQRVRGSVLGVRDFRRLWLAQAISTVGDQIFPIAATIAVLNAGGTAAQLGLILGARWLAIVIFALVGGVWADRISRRAVMIAADVFRAAIVAAIALWPGGPPLGVLALAVFAVGAGEAFFRPAQTALIPSLLPADRLPQANGLVSISYRTAAVVGPGLGGLLVVGLGSTQLAFSVNALAFGVSMAFLLGVHEPALPARDGALGSSFVRDAREGLAEVRRHRWVAGTLLAASLLLLLAVAPLTVLLPIIGREEYGTDTVFAISQVCFSLGGLAGALFAMAYRPRFVGSFSWLISLAYLGIPLALLLGTPSWVLFVAYAIGGFSWEPFAVYWASALQTQIPAERLARVSSVDWMATFGLMPLGLALTGPIVTHVGQDAVLVAAIASIVVLTLGVLRVPGVRDFRDPDVVHGLR